MPLVLTNASLIDGLSERVIAGASVTIEEGRIAEVLDGGRSPSTAGARVIDLAGAYLLPGLWDVHVHLEAPRIPGASVAEQTLHYAINATEGVTQAGVTGIRTAGVPHYIDVALRQAFDSGRLVGPRILAAGWFLTTTGGHALRTEFARRCDGREGFVQAIREGIEAGIDHVKLNLSGGIMGPDWDRHWHAFLLPEEIEAAFAICRQREFPVMAHAASTQTVKAALRLGAHSIEHGYVMDDECLALLVQRRTWYVPTLGITHLTPDQARTPWEKRWIAQRGLTPDLIHRAEDAVDAHREWFGRALRAGVRMALGSDVRPHKDGALLEMALWVRDGATPWQTLLAATRHAAELCGVGDELGTVEAGKRADLIVVGASPLDDIEHVRDLKLVLKDGRIVADHRRPDAG
jgi:imidazolonepropionase-like amidohydrolase